jgi:Cu-processing system ATP-binding protein
MIEIKAVSKHFGKLKALDNVSLSCNKGECIALIGPNGCGKTTLIKCILGMVIPSAGNIYFQGKSIAGEFAYRQKIGYMPQIGKYPDNMKIGQILEMISTIRHTQKKADEDLLQLYKFEKLMDKDMRTLSGGTTQKVSAALAFLFDPDVLILDEPTAGLDPLASQILKEKIIAERDRGKLILISSHLLSELDDLVTQIIFMQDGAVQFHKSVDDLMSSTGEEKIANAIVQIMKGKANEQDH